ncbi:MAG: ribokinase [Lachnospiraceae bacterium]
MKNKIVVIGSINYDIILKQERLPYKGETYAVDEALFCGGGKGANQAVQAAKLGAEVYMVGAVGNDAMGEYLRKSIKSANVNDKFLKTVNTVSGLGVVNCLYDGTVYANIVKGANYKITKRDIDELNDLMIDCKVLILQLEIPIEIVEYAIEKAKEKGIIVILNAAPSIDISEKSIKKCDYIIVNEVESSYYCKRTIDSVDAAEKEIINFTEKHNIGAIFTIGKDGAVVSDGKRVEHIPACKVEAIETTGAGDSFIGALGCCLVNGMDIFEASKFATYCSAITVCGIGAQSSMPDLKEVNEFIKNI